MQIVSSSLAQPDGNLPEVALLTTRQTLAKRRWRGVAADGTEFGFELERPLRPGDAFWQTVAVRYVIAQEPEDLLEIPLAMTPAAAAGIGWAVGNLHLELQAEPARLLALDEPAVRQLLGRLDVPFRSTRAVFRPGRFARGSLPTHDLGPSHQH